MKNGYNIRLILTSQYKNIVWGVNREIYVNEANDNVGLIFL